MSKENHKIITWKSCVSLSVVAYILYVILWMLVDKDSCYFDIRVVACEYLMLTLFTIITLCTIKGVFRLLPFKPTFLWSLLFACCLFISNNTIAFLMQILLDSIWPDPTNEELSVKSIYTYAMIATFVASVYGNMFFLRSYLKNRDEKQALELALMQEKEIALQSQFNSLKLQINPHFLFNSFNNLLSLIEENPERASSYLSRLSKLYRYIISNLDNALVPISEELLFLDNYIYLMHIRHGDNIKINITDELKSTAGFIAPATLQMLVENAIKHNGFSSETPLHITLTAEDGHIVVSNTRQPLLSEIHSTGLGNKILIERYAMLTTQPVKIEQNNDIYKVNIPVISKPYQYANTNS